LGARRRRWARHLGVGSYASWDEDTKIAWLSAELEGRRPLIPSGMPLSAEDSEVVATFRVAAELGEESLSGVCVCVYVRACVRVCVGGGGGWTRLLRLLVNGTRLASQAPGGAVADCRAFFHAAASNHAG
jgi:Phosphoenolpyruvate carboxylase